MVLLFEIFIVLAFATFAYESVIAPSLRLRLRYLLFSLRDELRWLQMNKAVDRNAFLYLQSGINNLIHMLHRFDVSLLTANNQRLETDPSLKRRVENRISVIEACQSDEFRRILKSLLRTARLAVFVNNGVWFLYLVPIVAIIISLGRLKRFIKDIISVPEGELVFPDESWDGLPSHC